MGAVFSCLGRAGRFWWGRRRTLGGRILFLFFAFSVSVELGLRLLYSAEFIEKSPACKLYGEPLFGAPRPNCQERFVTDQGAESWISYDADGLIQAPEGLSDGKILRVLLVGDCHVVNTRVSGEESIAYLLQSELRRRALKVNVFSTGTGGMSAVGAHVLISSLMKTAPRFDLVVYHLTEAAVMMSRMDSRRRRWDDKGNPSLELSNIFSPGSAWPVLDLISSHTMLPVAAHFSVVFFENLITRLFFSKGELIRAASGELERIRMAVGTSGSGFLSFFHRLDQASPEAVERYRRETRRVISNTSFHYLLNSAWIRSWEPELHHALKGARVTVLTIPLAGVVLPKIFGRLSGGQNRSIVRSMAGDVENALRARRVP